MSNAGTSITINISNRSSETLTFGATKSTAGTVPVANSVTVNPNAVTQVTASGVSQGCAGTFTLAGAAGDYAVAYNLPADGGLSMVATQTSAGLVWGTDAAGYSGSTPIASLNLYAGVASGTQGGYAVPLGYLAQPTYDDCQDFANSMFGPGMRSEAQIAAAYSSPGPAGYVVPADFTGAQLSGIVAGWASHWLGTSDVPFSAQDANLLDLLAHYIKTASTSGTLSLWLPTISYNTGTSPTVYTLSGYSAYALTNSDGSWNANAVTTFLTLLAAGGHFVAVSASADLPTGVSALSFDESLKQSGLSTRHDIGSSHYTSLLNVTGTYYLSVSDDFAPVGCGLILAFLTGRTVNDPLATSGTYNSFFQIEGWQSSVDSTRHNVDYGTFSETLWNLSTFGACPYSEKRGTTIFLAPPGWVPAVYQTTRMSPYVGAYASNPSSPQPQPWLNTALIQIPADAPKLPTRYFTS